MGMNAPSNVSRMLSASNSRQNYERSSDARGVAIDGAFSSQGCRLRGVSILLVLFLLDMGATAAARLRGSRSLTPRVIAFGLTAPLVFGALGVVAGTIAGLSLGGAAVLGTMAASASYIAAPAATRLALPDADHGLSLGVALGVTFPFNLALGIPIYVTLADLLA